MAVDVLSNSWWEKNFTVGHATSIPCKDINKTSNKIDNLQRILHLEVKSFNGEEWNHSTSGDKFVQRGTNYFSSHIQPRQQEFAPAQTMSSQLLQNNRRFSGCKWWNNSHQLPRNGTLGFIKMNTSISAAVNINIPVQCWINGNEAAYVMFHSASGVACGMRFVFNWYMFMNWNGARSLNIKQRHCDVERFGNLLNKTFTWQHQLPPSIWFWSQPSNFGDEARQGSTATVDIKLIHTVTEPLSSTTNHRWR